MRKVISWDGTTIAYEKAGDGPPIVLLGGGFRDHTAFTSLVPEMATWRRSPMWPANETMADTLAYDRAICGDGGLPVERLAKIEVPTLVINSESTSDWLRAATRDTAAALPNGRQVSLPGVWHKV